MPDETPQETQVQAPIETTRERPSTTDPAWHMLFDRLDRQDDNIKVSITNQQVMETQFATLKTHVNDEQDKFTAMLLMKVNKTEVAKDILELLRHSHMAQLTLLAVIGAMAPVIIANWTELVTSIKSVF